MLKKATSTVAIGPSLLLPCSAAKSLKVSILCSVIGSDQVVRVIPESEREAQILRAAFNRLEVSWNNFFFFL